MAVGDQPSDHFEEEQNLLINEICKSLHSSSALITAVRWKHQLLLQMKPSSLGLPGPHATSLSLADLSLGQTVFHRVSRSK